MTEEQAKQALAEIEAKYAILVSKSNGQIALLKQLCDQQEERLTEQEALIETYRKHDALQKATIEQLEQAVGERDAALGFLMMRFS